MRIPLVVLASVIILTALPSKAGSVNDIYPPQHVIDKTLEPEQIHRDILALLNNKVNPNKINPATLIIKSPPSDEFMAGGQIEQIQFQMTIEQPLIIDGISLEPATYCVESEVSRGSTPYQWYDAEYGGWSLYWSQANIKQDQCASSFWESFFMRFK